MHAAEVRIHAAVHEEMVKSGITSGQQCWNSNPASAPVDIPGRDFGHLQFPEGWSFLLADMEEVDAECAPMKYAPRMQRTSQMEKMRSWRRNKGCNESSWQPSSSC
ncbi:uncharacterized protein ACWYII_026651 isoform 1-T1 [Salvelinus alpinus]